MTMSDYSDLEQEIRNAPDLRILPKDTEVRARIVSVQTGESDKTDSGMEARYFIVTFDVPSDPLCPMFSTFFWDLEDKDKIGAKGYQDLIRALRDFSAAFGIDLGRPFSWEDDLPGLEGDVVLAVKKDKTGEYPDKNTIRKYIIPK